MFLNALSQTTNLDLFSAWVCVAFGLVSLVIGQTIALSQLGAVVKTRNTSGSSMLTYILFVVMSILTLSWGLSFFFQSAMGPMWIKDPTPVYVHEWTIIPIIVLYLSDGIFASWMIIIKGKNLHLCKKLNISELQLAEKLLQDDEYKYAKSKFKFYHNKWFKFAITVALIYLVLGVFAWLFTVYGDSFVGELSYNPTFPWVIPLGIIGSFAWEALSWPQFIKCLRNKDTSGISFNWSIFLPVACTISFVYALILGIVTGGEQFNLSTIGGLIFNGMIVNYGILFIKIRNRRRAKALNLTEIEYTKKYIIPEIERKQLLKKKRG